MTIKPLGPFIFAYPLINTMPKQREVSVEEANLHFTKARLSHDAQRHVDYTASSPAWKAPFSGVCAWDSTQNSMFQPLLL